MTLFHAFQQFQGALAIQQEVLVHHEEGLQIQLALSAFHDLIDLFASIEKVEALALPAEKRGGCTEVAAQRTTNTRNDGGAGRTDLLRQFQPHHALAESTGDQGMLDRRRSIFAQKGTHPTNAFAFDDEIGVDDLIQVCNRSHVAADDDSGMRRKLPDHAAHFLHLANVHHNAGNADHVVMLRGQFFLKVRVRWEVEHGGGSADVFLDKHDAPGAVEHAQRVRSLFAGDLVMVQLHRIDAAATELVILRIWTEDTGEQNTSLAALGMRKLFGHFVSR